MLRVTSWNVNSLRIRLEQVARFAREFAPDVLCLQEIKLAQDQFPVEALSPLFPHRVWWGEPGYNGVAVLSKLPLAEIRRGFADTSRDEGSGDRGHEERGPEMSEARLLTCTVAGIRLYDVYCPNGGSVGSARFRGKLRWFARLRAEIERYDRASDVMIVGDMNVAPGDLDVWNPGTCAGQLLCTADERAAFASLLDWGLHDAFREREPHANAFSWWDYKANGFQRNLGLRIDHALLSPGLMRRCAAVTIHRDVRGWDQPSDHAPVSVDLEPLPG
jgi:exodeoxyribonuclease-3